MIASLAMYPFAQVRAETNRLWQTIRDNLGWGPDELEWQVVTPAVWQHHDLLIAQCCGWPLVAELPNTIAVVGTFDYAVPDSHDGTYRSLIVTATDRSLDELRNDETVVAAVNDLSSLSGWISLKHAWGREPKAIVTGAHIESARLVGRGGADVACIDAVSYDLFREYEPAVVEGLRVVGQGPRIPCLPLFVPAAHADRVGELRAAFDAAVADPSLADARRALRIRRFLPRELADYQQVLTLAS